MTLQFTRQLVVEALRAANVPGLDDDPRIGQFVAGTGDVDLAELDLDSLGAMEFCIYIEVNHGVSIVPDTLREIATLGKLAGIVARDLP